MIQADNGLIYDANDSRCDFSMLRVKPDLTIGFVQCYDLSSGFVSRYCGVYDEYNHEQTIKQIMRCGAKFDTTVNYWSERI